jgi:hypothetical protein
MKRELLALLAPFAVLGCKQQTEIVLRLDAPASAPSTITVKLSRSTSFDSDPETPPFVVAALDGPDLDLVVTPQGKETVISLLPPQNGPSDLTAQASADGFSVMPDGPQASMFEDGASVPLVFTFTPLPMGDMAGPHDMAKPKDGGAGGG